MSMYTRICPPEVYIHMHVLTMHLGQSVYTRESCATHTQYDSVLFFLPWQLSVLRSMLIGTQKENHPASCVLFHLVDVILSVSNEAETSMDALG